MVPPVYFLDLASLPLEWESRLGKEVCFLYLEEDIFSFLEKALVHCIYKQTETLKQASSLSWDVIESGTLLLLDYILT
jgi:hypothetical protein